jgi:hypothetical protein
MSLKIIDGTPSSISKFIREKEEMKLKKQGAVEELKKELKWIEVQQEHYEVNPYNKEGYKLCDEAREEVLDLLSERKEQLIKELKEGV